MSMSIGMIIDIFLIGLTGVLLGYCFFLNRNIKNFNKSKDNFTSAVGEFIRSYTSAEETLISLRETLQFSEKKLDDKIVKAEKLFDELEFIVQTGNNIANRIEASSKQTPHIKKVSSVQSHEDIQGPKTKIEKLLQQKLAQARR